jgi:nickel-type superoxide dismutase maturation protease
VRRRSVLLLVVALWALIWTVNRSLVAVQGPSMSPTLRPGERLLTLPALVARPRPGSVVVVEDPWQPGHLVVKRVARIDGAAPSAQVLVLGDNPEASTDGRVWGPIGRDAVRRVVVARWPSLSRAGLSGGRQGRRASSSSSGSSSATSPSARRP